MAELELERPDQADAPVDGGLLSDLPMAQAELVFLELWRIRREMFADPGARKLSVGSGNPAEQTLEGNRQDPYNGVVIFNPTPITLSVGFEAGTGWLAPAIVPPFTCVSFPERFTNLSIATLNPVDVAAPVSNPVTVLRLRIPPAPFAATFGAGGGPLVSIAGGQALASGAALDNATPRAYHALAVMPTGVATAGVVTLQASLDGVAWFNTTAVWNFGAGGMANVGPFAARFIRAAITTAIVGATVTATVASS